MMTAAHARFDASVSRQTRLQPLIASSGAASSYDPTVERTRRALVAAVEHIVTAPVTWREEEPAPIDSLSAETAIAFIQQLPPDRAFPKVAPDGEGGIMLVWREHSPRALITADRGKLLLIANPGQPNSHHFRPLNFDGETIPAIVLVNIPQR
jgi:hypothetical protein